MPGIEITADESICASLEDTAENLEIIVNISHAGLAFEIDTDDGKGFISSKFNGDGSGFAGSETCDNGFGGVGANLLFYIDCRPSTALIFILSKGFEAGYVDVVASGDVGLTDESNVRVVVFHP